MREQFILNSGIKSFGGIGILAIVGAARRIDVRYFLIKSTLAAAYILDTGKLFFKVVFTKNII